jgi:hypothetical protein
MKSLLCLFLIAFVSEIAIAQVAGGTDDNNNFQNYLLSVRDRAARNNVIYNDYIEGSAYLKDEFSIGEVVSKDGVHKGIKMKYNICYDIFEIELYGKPLYLEPTNYIKKIIYEGNTYVVRNMPDSKKEYEFVIEKSSGSLSFYQKKITIFKQPEAPTAVVATPKPARYLKRPDKFCIQLGSGPLVVVDNFKDFYQLFPALADGLKNLVKTEKLDFKSENDLMKVVDYCSKNI